MPANKRIRKSPARTAKALVAETTAAPLRADDWKKAVHRLEVEIASAGVVASERRHRGGGYLQPRVQKKSYGVHQRLIHVQVRKRRARWLMQAAMFLTSTCLLAGTGAWLYRFWQEMH